MLYVSVKASEPRDSKFPRDVCVKLESVYIPVRVQMSREDRKREARTWVVLHPSNTTPPTQHKPTGPPGPCSSSIHQPGTRTTPKAKDLPESVRGWYMDLSRATETHTSCPVNTAEAAGSPAKADSQIKSNLQIYIGRWEKQALRGEKHLSLGAVISLTLYLSLKRCSVATPCWKIQLTPAWISMLLNAGQTCAKEWTCCSK